MTAAIIGLVVLASFIEGLGLAFLVPLLETISAEGEAVPLSGISRSISTGLGWFHLPFRLWTIMVGGFVLFATQALLSYLRQTQSVKLSAGVSADVRIELNASLLRSDMAYLQSRKGGEFANSLITEPGRYQGAFTGTMNLIALAISSITYLSVALILSWSLLLAAVGLISIVSLLVKFEIGRAGRYGTELSRVNADVQSTTMEQLGGIRIVRAFNLETVSGERFRSLALEMAKLYYVTIKSRARMEALFEAGVVGGLMVIVYYAVTVADMSVSVLLTFIFVLFRFYPRVGAINKAFHGLMFGIPAVHNITNLIEETRTPTVINGTTHHSRLKDGIRFEDVSFSYDDDSPVLDRIDFTVRPGEAIAIVGSSGEGKTTLVNLLMRFYDPSDGRILVDGIDLRELDMTSWRSTLSLVNQDIFLFNATISKNIVLGKLDATEEEIVAAARSAYADEFIDELPDGYDTIIGDRGVRLSGGQRQRLALARAIVRDPQILILDEATSELDSKSEQLIQQAIVELGASRTIFTIAHRLSTIRHADNILVIENGRIAEEGNHERLLETNGSYAEFLRIQEEKVTQG